MEIKTNVPSSLYVDIENLQSNAKDLLISLLENWPSAVPHPTKIVLYVRADMVELWKMWVYANINGPVVEVNGVQHFTVGQSKNSADIAIAVDAITDLLNGLAHHIAVFSDDSDFISLFAKIRIETKDIQSRLGRIPFLWILTDRDKTKSPNIIEFFPDEYLHIVRALPQISYQQTSVTLGQTPTFDNSVKSKSQDNLITEAILKEIPIGKFKSADCHDIVKRRFPNYPVAKQSAASFGEYIAKTIWPLLNEIGVELTGDKPRRYEMTQAAKNSIAS